MRVPYAGPSYGHAEICAVIEALADPAHLVAGPRIAEFERRIADLLGQSHGVMLNSGSSANLIALLTLKRQYRIPDGAKVLTPALTFATCVTPILQAKLRPVFCDVEPGTYIASVDQIADGIYQHDAELVLYPLLLGNTTDLHELDDLCHCRSVRLVLDSCDTLGQPMPVMVDAVTTSFYASHIITAAGTGGMACFPDPDTAAQARMIAHWGRQSIVQTEAERFTGNVDGVPYDSKFVFAVEGYNLQPMELQAAFGLAQLESLNERAQARRAHFWRLIEDLHAQGPVRFEFPYWHRDTVPLAFPLTIQAGAPFSRNEICQHLESRGIETRPIMGGNITRQPAFAGSIEAQDFPVADKIMKDGLLIGCHQSLTDAQIQYMLEAFDEFLTARRAA